MGAMLPVVRQDIPLGQHPDRAARLIDHGSGMVSLVGEQGHSLGYCGLATQRDQGWAHQFTGRGGPEHRTNRGEAWHGESPCKTGQEKWPGRTIPDLYVILHGTCTARQPQFGNNPIARLWELGRVSLGPGQVDRPPDNGSLSTIRRHLFWSPDSAG